MNFYSIYDAALAEYLPPFQAKNDATACRALQEDMRRPDTNIKTPNDYTLYQVGTWDGETGQLKGEPPKQIAPLIALIAKE